jgi:catechol 2,3-dioxygenase-like lactoylglutathione lyase family enzyme
MTVAPPPSHYHVGMIVPDVRAARRRFSELLGVVWGPLVDLDSVEYRDEAGRDVVLPSTFCYSVGTPSLELVQEVPGSVWSRNDHSNLHHVGYWSDDLPTQSAALGDAGCPLQLCGRSGSRAPVTFAYHCEPELGVRIELIDAALRPALAPLFEPDPAGP